MPEEYYENDEYLFNRARQLTIATHQHIVFTDWLPQFIPEKMSEINFIVSVHTRMPFRFFCKSKPLYNVTCDSLFI